MFFASLGFPLSRQTTAFLWVRMRIRLSWLPQLFIVWCAPIGNFGHVEDVVFQPDSHGRTGPVQDCSTCKDRRPVTGKVTAVATLSGIHLFLSVSLSPSLFQPPLSDAAAAESRAAATHVETMYCSSETGETGRGWHSGSHCRYTELLRKHQRHPQGMESTDNPLTIVCRDVAGN